MNGDGRFQSPRRWMPGIVVLGTLALAASGLATTVAYDDVIVSNHLKQVAGGATNFFLGKLGVGTNAPASDLHVAGDGQVDGELTVSGAMRVPKQGDVSMGPYTNGLAEKGTSLSSGVDDLSDADVSSASVGDLLRYDGTKWVNTSGFVERDASGYDWDTGDFTTDGGSYDLDLSSIVPTGVKAVLVRVLIRDNLLMSGFRLGPKGGASQNFSYIRTHTDLYTDATWVISIGSDQKLTYSTTNDTFTDLHLVVLGWWY